MSELTVGLLDLLRSALAEHDSGTIGGMLYYTMPFVAGGSLRERLTREQQLPIPDVVAITGEVAVRPERSLHVRELCVAWLVPGLRRFLLLA